MSFEEIRWNKRKEQKPVLGILGLLLSLAMLAAAVF